jgi:uncharacterized protein YukJ
MYVSSCYNFPPITPMCVANENAPNTKLYEQQTHMIQRVKTKERPTLHKKSVEICAKNKIGRSWLLYFGDLQ